MAALDAPHIFINEYMKNKIAELADEDPMAFLPTVPSSMDTIGEIQLFTETGTSSANPGKVAVYDRMFKLRRQAFPVLKYEQLLYYFYAYSTVELQKLQQRAQDLLDWGDQSAQELNEWAKGIWEAKGSNYDTNGRPILYFGTSAPADTNDWFAMPFFHEIKIFQLEESRDIIDFGTARTFAGNKLIIDYCWHA